MAFAPNIIERIARAREDARLGVPVVLSIQGEGFLVFAAETISEERLGELRAQGIRPELAITARRAETLKARAYDGDLARIALPSEVGLEWVRSVADPADDLKQPMKGPLMALREGDAAPARLAIALMKSAQLLPSALVTPLPDAARFAAENELTVLPMDLAGPLIAESSSLSQVIAARVPLAVSEAGRLHIFRPDDGSAEHYAIEIGRPDRSKPVLARLHSACFTGDVLGSLKCDCGPQLQAALAQMGADGEGILLYLNQEGRGIGLANKMRAYSLQEQGFDTVEANHRLGFEDDERDFRVGSKILKSMGFESVRLLTNNPRKIEMMEHNDIAVVERVPLKVGLTAHNKGYLDTKAKKSGHLV